MLDIAMRAVSAVCTSERSLRAVKIDTWLWNPLDESIPDHASSARDDYVRMAVSSRVAQPF